MKRLNNFVQDHIPRKYQSQNWNWGLWFQSCTLPMLCLRREHKNKKSMSVSPTEYFDSGLKTCEWVSFWCQKNEVSYSSNILKKFYLFIIYNFLLIIYLYFIKLVIYYILLNKSASRLSLVVANRGCCLVAGHGLLLLQITGFRPTSFSSCYIQAQKLWLMGLVGPKHGESTQTRDQTCVPSVDRWILNHWTTRKVLNILIYFKSVNLDSL